MGGRLRRVTNKQRLQQRQRVTVIWNRGMLPKQPLETTMLSLQSFAACLTDPKYPQDLNGTVDTKQLWADWAIITLSVTAIDPDLTAFSVANVVDRFLGKPCPVLEFTYRNKSYYIADIGGGDILLSGAVDDLQAICAFMDINHDDFEGGVDLPAQYIGEIMTAIEQLPQ